MRTGYQEVGHGASSHQMNASSLMASMQNLIPQCNKQLMFSSGLIKFKYKSFKVIKVFDILCPFETFIGNRICRRKT